MKKYVAFILALIMVFALCACSQSPAPAPSAATNPSDAPAGPADPDTDDPLAGIDMKPVNWSFGCHVGSTSSYYLMEVEFANRVAERTNGLVNITVYANGELPYASTDFVRLVSDKTIEMAAIPVSYASGECPTCGVIGWPFLAGEVDELDIAVAAALPFVNEELGAKGVRCIGWTSAPMQTMFGNGKTPQTLADLNGRKLRVFDAYQPILFSDFGITSVSMTMGEVLPAMQKNTVDSALTGIIAASDSAWYDVCTWGYLLPVSASTDMVLINEELLNGLPEVIQQIILEEAEQLTEDNKAFAASSIDSSIQNMKDHGMEIVFPSDADIQEMETKAGEYWDVWIKDQTELTQQCFAAIREAVGK